MSLKTNRYGASQRNGLTPGGKTNRSMTNLGNKTINAAANSNQKPQYTGSGDNYRDANNNKVSGLQVDEGRLSSVVRKSPERPHVVASPGALKNQGGITEKLYLDGKPEMKAMRRGEKLIPAKKAMGRMATPVKSTMRGEKLIPVKKAMKTAGKLTPAKTAMKTDSKPAGKLTPAKTEMKHEKLTPAVKINPKAKGRTMSDRKFNRIDRKLNK